MTELAGRRALVTGGSAGIGFMIARGLAAAGAEVFISLRKADACERAAKEIAAVGSCTAIAADLSREESWDALAAELGAEPLHVLVNNAGGMGRPDRRGPHHRLDNFAYTASKAAMHQLTRHLAAKLAPERITVSAIPPGPFATTMMAYVFDNPIALDEMERLIPPAGAAAGRHRRDGEPAGRSGRSGGPPAH